MSFGPPILSFFFPTTNIFGVINAVRGPIEWCQMRGKPRLQSWHQSRPRERTASAAASPRPPRPPPTEVPDRENGLCGARGSPRSHTWTRRRRSGGRGGVVRLGRALRFRPSRGGVSPTGSRWGPQGMYQPRPVYCWFVPARTISPLAADGSKQAGWSKRLMAHYSPTVTAPPNSVF